MNDNNVLIGELCHIEAAERGGPRYNEIQTDDERRGFDNLMFLCHQHHKETDDDKKYTVARLKEMKKVHEALNASVCDPDRIVDAFQRFEGRLVALQKQVSHFISARSIPFSGNYAIHTPGEEGSWIPQEGKMYTYPLADGSQFRVMMKAGLACIEHVFRDGAVAYYEVDEQGSVKENRFPYPLDEYDLIIPPDMLVKQESRVHSDGVTETLFALKWGRTVTVVRDRTGRLVEANILARMKVDHQRRRIEIVST